MKIYLDLVIILNFLFDFLLLFGVSIILRRKTSLKKLFLSSFIGLISLLTLFISINSLFFLITKIVISILMVIISFSYRDIKYTLRNLFYLYTTSVVLGGFFYLINIKIDSKLFFNNGLLINFLLLLLIFPIILFIYIKQIKEIRNNYANYYNVDIYLKNGQVKELTAFLDTGNKLIDPYQNRPIILVNKKEINFDFFKENILLVPYDTLNNHGLLKCIIPEKIYIDKVGMRNNFLIGISEEEIKIDGVDCILNSKLLERKGV